MGMFSWKTLDTGRSIAVNCAILPTFKVIMTDDKGHRWVEENYEGYGMFGGKDFYVLLDEMNGGTGNRDVGIDKAYDSDKKDIIFPSLSEDGEYYNGISPEPCEFQGFFYEDEDEDNDWDDDDYRDDDDDYWDDEEDEE